MVRSHGPYGLLLGRDWLRRVSATANYQKKVYSIRVDRKRAPIKQNQGSCEVLLAREEELDSDEEQSDELSGDESEESDYSHMAHMEMVMPLDG